MSKSRFPGLTWIFIIFILLSARSVFAEPGYKQYPRGEALISVQELAALIEQQQAWNAMTDRGV